MSVTYTINGTRIDESELDKLVITAQMSGDRIIVKHFGFSPEYERKEEKDKCTAKS